MNFIQIVLKRFIPLLFLLMINNCTKNKSSTDSLKVSLKSELTYFDPQLAEGETSQEILSLLYEPLLDYQILDGQYRFQNLLLTKNPTLSLNSKTISFELKSGVKFSKNSLVKENRDLNADDVIYTILRLADPHLNSPNYWLIERQILGLDEWREKQKNQKQSQYQEIPKGLKKIDDTHLEILLAVPNPQILHAFATVALAILPKELAAESFNKWESENIGTGPYQVNSKMEKGNIELQRRKDYWNAEEQGPPVILAKYFGSEAVKLSAFEHKEIDIMQLGKGSLKQFINPETKSLVEEKKSLKLSEKSLLDVVYVGFNMEDPTIKKLGANFRKAISLAIDKNYYNIAMNEGAGVLAQSPVPPGISGYKAEYNNRYAQFDVEKAKDFLKKSNIKTEKLSALKFESLNTPEALKFAEVFKNNLSQIGIGMEIITNPDVNSIMEKIRSKEAQMWLLSWQADYPDAENFLQLLYGPNRTPSPNFSNFDDPVFNKLFTKMRLLAESPERNKAIEEMMNLFVRNAPWVPLIHRTEFYVSHPNIEGFFPKQFGSSHYKTVKISVPAQ